MMVVKIMATEPFCFYYRLRGFPANVFVVVIDLIYLFVCLLFFLM